MTGSRSSLGHCGIYKRHDLKQIDLVGHYGNGKMDMAIPRHLKLIARLEG